MNDLTEIAVGIPTLNTAEDWHTFSDPLKRQGIPTSHVLVIDSSSNDATRELAEADGYRVTVIDRKLFSHGGSRQTLANQAEWANIIVFLTQDALLASDNAIRSLIKAFDDPTVVAAYGRQLPRPSANPIEAHARLFNYPALSATRDLTSRERIGFKAAFLSNSFAAYRRDALLAAGGFREDTIFGEDTIMAGSLLLAGYKIAYVADACVYHSHSYSWTQEFRRSFDIGVMHKRESWMLKEFGRPTGEGRRFVLSELKYVAKNNFLLLPSAVIRTGMKVLGYKLGMQEDRLGTAFKRRLSLNPTFWSR
jgi:rhamnosyltransferase